MSVFNLLSKLPSKSNHITCVLYHQRNFIIPLLPCPTDYLLNYTVNPFYEIEVYMNHPSKLLAFFEWLIQTIYIHHIYGFIRHLCAAEFTWCQQYVFEWIFLLCGLNDVMLLSLIERISLLTISYSLHISIKPSEKKISYNISEYWFVKRKN